ncbi:MAG: hypothetical protein Q7S13_02830 [Candidatus Omnitrophota bacterium]|jgi:hypothetical protein|nr:hypothetical protein [Candidatus Omnitrophota bacterium]
MNPTTVIIIVANIEILIGSITFLANIVFLILGINAKPPNVFIFVMVAAMASFALGVGLRQFKRPAYQLLRYFAFAIFFSKCLILLGVLQLNGSLETTIPSSIKTMGSLIYHGTLLYLFSRPDFKKIVA